MNTKEVNVNDIIGLTNGKFLIVKSYTKDGLMKKNECHCYKHCYLSKTGDCRYWYELGCLKKNVIKNNEQYDLYADAGRCPLASGLCFKELEGGI